MIGTFWAFVPAIVAIVLALISKQVYVSLFFGIFVGAMFLAGGNPVEAIGNIYTVMSEKVGGNVSIIAFLVILGILVVLMQKSGGSMAYGTWASKKIRSEKGALAATAGLGCLIFVDDYFNCLTVGSVMRPLTDKYKTSRSKLAWIIDSTAAPVCIIAPISSWAAAVAGELEGNSLSVFMSTIPFNVYAILTLVMVFAFCLLKVDFGKMKSHEHIAKTTGDLNAGSTDLPAEEKVEFTPKANPRVQYLLIPVIILILSCIGGMIYVGYFYNWDTGVLGRELQSSSVIEAFSNCDAGLSLAIGSTIALFIISVYYICMKALSFKEITESFTQGFKTMVPAILILTFAWTLSGIMGAKGGYLDARGFVESTLAGLDLNWLFPAVFFLLACGIAFATGTSWGTFGVLIPLATAILGTQATTITVMTISATLGGAVFGDHVSPISDTTILASAGANCNHVNHVNTQLPYAGLIACISLLAYLVGGLTVSLGSVLSCVILWAVALVLFVGAVLLIKLIDKKKATAPVCEETTSAQVEE